MRHHENGRSLLLQLIHAVIAFCLKEDVSYRKSLINNQDFGVDGNVKGKGQADEHTAGIGLDRLIHEVSDVGKVQDIRKLLVHLLLTDAHHGAVHVNVFNPGIVLVKARSKLQECADGSLRFHAAACRGQYTGNNLQHCGFSGAVCSDNPHRLTLFHGKGYVLQGKKVLMIGLLSYADTFQQSIYSAVIQTVDLAYVFHGNQFFVFHLPPSLLYAFFL